MACTLPLVILTSPATKAEGEGRLEGPAYTFLGGGETGPLGPAQILRSIILQSNSACE